MCSQADFSGIPRFAIIACDKIMKKDHKQEVGQLPLVEREDANPSQPAKTLKKEVGNVSLVSQGFLNSLQSPKASKASPETPC